MAITTVDQIIAGMLPPEPIFKVGTAPEAVGVMYSPFYATGRPGAALAPSPGLAGAALTTYAGQIPYYNPSPGNNMYLARFGGQATQTGTLYLFDRLWHNSGIAVTTTTSQTINSVAWPARDRDGTTNGENVLVGIEVSTATTNAGAVTNTTMTYTDSQGNAGAVATISSFPATAVIGTFVPFQLAAGDTGVRSIQSITLGTSYGGGAIHLVAYRLLAKVDITVANIGSSVDAITSGFPRLYDNTVPFLMWLPANTNAATVFGEAVYTQG